MTNIIKNNKRVLKRLKTLLNKEHLFFVPILAYLFLISGCATVQQPTGGPKDETPPKVLSIVPENLTRNFDKNEIQITFDEFVKLRNEFTEISISPDMDEAPMYKIKKKSLIITLPDSLEENTTYSINFGNSIVDFNEGNELKSFSYIFSTGPEIDSLSISGNIINALNLEEEPEVTVLLIPTKQDSIFGKKKANIFTQTDSAGNFSLKNLHEGSYRIYGLKETNNDRIYNNPEELIGFLKDSIQLEKDTAGIKLVLFKEIPKDFRVLNRSIDPKGKITILFNKPLENPSLTLLNDPALNLEKITEFTNTKDTAYTWLPKLTFDSLEIEIKDGSTILDTTKLKRNNKDKYDTEIILTDNLNRRLVDKVKNIQITASSPLKEFDKTKIVLTEDSVARQNFQITLDTAFKRKAVIKYNWRPNRNYHIKFEAGAFTDFFGEKSALIEQEFTYDDTENYGDVILNIMVPDSNSTYLVQLLNENDQIILSSPVDHSQKVNYNNMPGTKYKVRIVYDENKNNRWDTGNVEEKIQPEKIWFWNKILTIRPNWEQEETIEIPSPNLEVEKKVVPEKEDTPKKLDEKEEPVLNKEQILKD